VLTVVRSATNVPVHPATEEPGLVVLLQSFDNLIEDARESILSERIYVFELHRKNNFIRGRHFKKPLHMKLLNGTYRKHQAVWHKLLCYVYRLTVTYRGPNLHYILTPSQLNVISQIPTSALPSRSQSVCTARSKSVSPVVSVANLRTAALFSPSPPPKTRRRYSTHRP